MTTNAFNRKRNKFIIVARIFSGIRLALWVPMAGKYIPTQTSKSIKEKSVCKVFVVVEAKSELCGLTWNKSRLKDPKEDASKRILEELSFILSLKKRNEAEPHIKPII